MVDTPGIIVVIVLFLKYVTLCGVGRFAFIICIPHICGSTYSFQYIGVLYHRIVE